MRDERRRLEALEPSSNEPLNVAERAKRAKRAELLRLRREVAAKDQNSASLGLC